MCSEEADEDKEIGRDMRIVERERRTLVDHEGLFEQVLSYSYPFMVSIDTYYAC